MKKVFSLFLLPLVMMSACSAPGSSADASAEASAENSAEDTVYALIAAENAKDWDAYVELWCQSERDDYAAIIQNPYKQAAHTGLFDIKSAEAEEVTEISLEDATPYLLNLDVYESTYDELAAFLVGVDYQVYREDKYYTNGVNYRLALLGVEDGEWRMVEWATAQSSLYEDKSTDGSSSLRDH